MLPEYQGRGLAAGLLSDVPDDADRLGISTRLQTFMLGNASYRARLD